VCVCEIFLYAHSHISGKEDVCLVALILGAVKKKEGARANPSFLGSNNICNIARNKEMCVVCGMLSHGKKV